MSVIRNLVIVFGFLIFAINVNAAPTDSIKPPEQSSPNKVVVSENLVKRININSVDAATLQKIKSFGKKKAQAVIEYRNKNGAFSSPEDLLKVKARGLNKKWLDKISKFLTV